MGLEYPFKNALFLRYSLIRLCGNRVFRNLTNYEIIYSYEISVLFLRYEKFFGNFSKVVCSRWILSYVYTLRLIRPISCPGECDLMVHRRKYTASFSHEIILLPTYVTCTKIRNLLNESQCVKITTRHRLKVSCILSYTEEFSMPDSCFFKICSLHACNRTDYIKL